jgi:methylenetetrahydromethanopterin dehydrogenase
MSVNVVKVGVLKVGCLGTLTLLDMLLDERADRIDIDAKVIGTGAKVGPKQCKKAAEVMLNINPDLVILVGPAQTTPGPTQARKMLNAEGIPTILISDSPIKKVVADIERAGQGYIIVEADSMIGARREFLDPAEMALYNANVIKVLAVTGSFNIVVKELDKTILSIKRGQDFKMPHIVINADLAIEAAGFSNPYARSKAYSAFLIACQVSKITSKACFKIQDPTVYIPMVAAAHEMMRAAAKLADEAREIEKSGNTVLRKPHFKDGELGSKRALVKKPTRTR